MTRTPVNVTVTGAAG
ncbi:hypothetical protein, partial [Streptomyces sp. TSRI0281]